MHTQDDYDSRVEDQRRPDGFLNENLSEYDPTIAFQSVEAAKNDAKDIFASGYNKDFMDNMRGITSDGIKDHMALYGEVLSHYTHGLSEDVTFKKESKKKLFSICVFIMCIVVIALFVSIIKGDASIESCVKIVLPFMTTFIVIPKTITDTISKDT